MTRRNGNASRPGSHRSAQEALRNAEAASLRPDHGTVQGEGDLEAAHNFNEGERRFVAAGRVPAAARAAAPATVEEEASLLAAERKGKGRAK